MNNPFGQVHKEQIDFAGHVWWCVADTKKKRLISPFTEFETEFLVAAINNHEKLVDFLHFASHPSGVYSIDALTFAKNTIQAITESAQKLLADLEGDKK